MTSSPGTGGALTTPSRRAGLHLVEPSSEQMLREAFQLEDDLLNQLQRCRLTQKSIRQQYARERGLLILPGFETLRKAVGRK